jgi:PAS domain S-box-containing protein
MSPFRIQTQLLLVEDNPSDARLVELLLQETDDYAYNITQCSTLGDALAALEAREFEVVLLDLTLPDSSGFDTLKNLLERFPETNVIVLTGLSDKELGIKSVRAGAQDFLIKGDYDTALLSKSLKFSIERKQVVKRLEEAQRMAHIGNWECGPNSERFVASAEVYKMFGYPVGDPSFLKIEVGDNTGVFAKIHEETLKYGYAKKDVVLHRRDGQAVYAFIKCDVVHNYNGDAVRLSGIIQDLTERKQAEMETARNRKLYEQIFNQSSDAICFCGLDGTIVEFNKAAEALFGQDAADMRSRKFHELFGPQAARELFVGEIEKDHSVKDVEIKVTDEKGETRHCLLTANVMSVNDIAGFNAIIRDVTKKKQEEALKKAQENAKMKDEFLARISHDMRLPMTVVMGYNNMMMETELTNEQAGYLKIIRETSENLLGVIEDILEISTLQYGEMKFEQAPFNLHNVMASLSTLVAYKLADKEVDFEIAIDESIPMVLVGDAKRLNQVLMNITGNAVKFTEKGHIHLKVQPLETSADKVKLRFSVEDTGIGIQADKLESVFDSFTKVINRDRLYEGTGLGLAIVKSLVEKQGGIVAVTSQKDKGSTFYFDLSFGLGSKENGISEAEINGKAAAENYLLDANTQVRILCAEDHKLLWPITKQLIEKKWVNASIDFVENGLKAIEALEKQAYNLVMMDMEMPVMNGREATHYIRTKLPEALARTPIIAVTADANLAKQNKYLEYQLDDYVTKPFANPDELYNKIKQHIKPMTKKPDAPSELINLDYLEMMADNDDEMKKTMLEMLAVEPLQEVRYMKELFASADWKQLAKVAHKMKSTLAFVGNEYLSDTNKSIEAIAKKEAYAERAQLGALLAAFEKVFEKVTVEINKALDLLNRKT